MEPIFTVLEKSGTHLYCTRQMEPIFTVLEKNEPIFTVLGKRNPSLLY